MTKPIDPRPGWVRRRTRELQETGMRYAAARAQAEAEADEKFDHSNGDDGNGATG